VAALRPHQQQLRGLDAAVTTATGREHEDGNGGGDCEDVTRREAHAALWLCLGIVSFAAGGGGGGGGDAACLTAGDRIKREGK
jgi:hypothetical protein